MRGGSRLRLGSTRAIYKISAVKRRVFLIAFLAGLAGRLPAQWEPTSGPYGGNITSFAISPNGTEGSLGAPAEAENLFVGTWGSGVFRSTNNGINWTAVNTGLRSTSVRALAISADSSKNLFAGTWGGGVFRSTNNGTDWTAVNTGLTNTDVKALAISPDSSGTLFAGTLGGGVFRSTDNGTTWTAVNTGLTVSYISTLAVSPSAAGGTNLFAGTWGGVFHSTNNGITWTAVNTGLTNTDIQALAISPDSRGDLFAGTYGAGVFRSTDNGTHWTAVNIGLTNSLVSSLAVFPNSSGNLLAGTYGGGVFRSIDNGTHWTVVDAGLTNTDVQALAISPDSSGDLFAGTYGSGVFRSTNNGADWTAVNTGLTNTDVRALAISPDSSGNLFAGTSGGGVFRSTNSGADWTSVNIGWTNTDVQALAISPDSSRNLFAGTSGGGVFRSTDNGTHWTAVNAGLTNTGVRALAISPDPSGNLFAGTSGGGVFRSTDNGTHWTAANAGLTSTNVSALAISPDSSGNLFAGTWGGGVFRFTDNGANWTAANAGLTSTNVSALAVSPDSSGNLFAGTWGSGVFHSTDNGTNWTAVNNGLTHPYVLSLAVSSSGAGGSIVFAGTPVGVFLSANNGTNWTAVNTGLTNTWIGALAVSPTETNGQTGAKDLFAGTEGGGVYRLSISRINDIASITLLAPRSGQTHVLLNNSGEVPGSTTLSWKFAPGVLVTLDTHLQLAIDSSFSSGLILDTTVRTYSVSESQSVRVSHLASGTTYYWRVSMVRSDGSDARWSQTWNFTTARGDIAGIVYDDLNRNGLKDVGEPGNPNWSVVMSGSAGGTLWTDTAGHYEFGGLDSGAYAVTVRAPASWTLTTPDTDRYVIPLGLDSVRRDVNFGWSYPWNSIRGMVFEDINENGRFDSSAEHPLPGWPIVLSGYESKQLATDEHGSYLFQRLSAAHYNVTLGPAPPGWEGAPSGVGTQYEFFFSSYNNHPGQCDFPVHRIPVRVKMALTVTDNGHLAERILRFGVRKGATIGLWGVDSSCTTVDYAEGEFEIPPILPGMFDARFVDPGVPPSGRFGMGGWIDMRPYVSAAEADTYQIRFQPGTVSGGNYPMTIRWSRIAIDTNYEGPVLFRDRYSRETDLKLSDSLVVSDSTIDWLQLVAARPLMPKTDAIAGEAEKLPSAFELAQNYPNPFNPTTTIRYELPVRSSVTLKIYNVLGQVVATLVNEVQDAGFKQVVWSTQNLASNVYFYRLQAGTFTEIKKMMLAR